MKHDKITNDLADSWDALAGRYSRDKPLIRTRFVEIVDAYNSADRYYHNLQHLHSLLFLSEQHRESLNEKDVVDFAIFYHDFVYTVSRYDNEERSAKVARERLATLGVGKKQLEKVSEFIIATKDHKIKEEEKESDIAWFLDFDMSILGADAETYSEYTRQVRSEYRIYPDPVYNEGRKKFLQQTLLNPTIFHTSIFQASYEPQARANIRKELESLYS